MSLNGLASGVFNLGSTVATNQMQKAENEKNREYNLKLAQMQNQWNIEQWQRENDYNSPIAQVQRLRAAGLNPDLLYGGGISNTSASSPQMTAGAPSSPTQLVGMPNSFNDFLDAEIKERQIDLLDKDLEKKGIDNKYLDAEKELGITLSRQQYEKNKNEISILLEEVKQARVRSETVTTEARIKHIEAAFRSEELQTQLKILANQLKLSDNEVQHMLTSKVLELENRRLDAEEKRNAIKWSDPSILESIGGEGAAGFFKVLMMLLKH